MKILDNYRRSGGLWGDVVALPTGGYAWFYSVHGAMVCEATGEAVWETPVPTDFLRFTRGAAVVPAPFALGQALDNTCFHVTAHNAVPDGIAFGQNPVACGLAGESYVMRNGREYTKNGVPVAVPLTSQGIRDVLPDGTVVMGDPTYHAVINDHPFWQYQVRGDVIVGQAGGDVGIGVLHGTDYLVIPRAGEPLGVHQALLADGTLAVCGWTQQYGAELWLIDLHAESEPKPDPIPEPEPQPEPIPMPDLNLRAEVAAERAKYPAMLTDDQPALILNAVALAENKRIGRVDWGLSAKPHGNHVPSPQGIFVAYDILHYRPGNRLFDALTGDLAGVVTWGETSYHGDPTGRPWVAPVAVGPTPEPEPEPRPEPPAPPPPPAGPSWDELMALVEAMNAANKNTRLAQVIPIVADRDLYPIRTAAHMFWGFLREGRTVADIVQDVIRRGNEEA